MNIPVVSKDKFYRVYYREIFPDGNAGMWHIHSDKIISPKFAAETKADIEKFGCYNRKHCEACVFECVTKYKYVEIANLSGDEKALTSLSHDWRKTKSEVSK